MEPLWLTEARRRFGDREEVFAYVETPNDLWSNLRDVFAAAYKWPCVEADIRNIYEYADWSCRQPVGAPDEPHLPTVVAVGFLEHIPEVPAAVKDLPRWFKREEILTMREILSYHAGPAGFQKLLDVYPRPQRAGEKRKK